MLSEHTLDQLRALRLDGMVRAIEDQATSTAVHELPFDDPRWPPKLPHLWPPQTAPPGRGELTD